MRLPARQRGLTLWGWLLVLFAGGFVAMVTFKLVPGYLDYYRIAATLEAVRDEAAVGGMDQAEIRKRIDRRFVIEGIREHSSRDVDIAAARNGLHKVSIDYEFRRNIIANVDVAVRFAKAVEVKSRW